MILEHCHKPSETGFDQVHPSF